MSAVESDTRVANPFGEVVAQPSNASAVAIVQREIAEIQAMVMVAKKFPRDPIASMDRILNACARPSLAGEATYEYARGGSQVSGASIRLAEVMAMNWGNLTTGVIELSRSNGVSECMAYAWDLETLYRDEKRFQVRHWRDTKKGGYQVTDERDIYELVANMGARRKRACILAVIPGDVQESALRQCETTLKAKVEITPESIKSMVEGFASYGVSAQMIEAKIQRRLDSILPAQVLQLRRIFTALRDGMGIATDYFDVPDPVAGTQAATSQAEAIKEKIRGKQPAKTADTKAPAAAADKKEPEVPHYSTETAIAALKKCSEPQMLKATWDQIVADYSASQRDIPIEVEALYRDVKESLQS